MWQGYRSPVAVSPDFAAGLGRRMRSPCPSALFGFCWTLELRNAVSRGPLAGRLSSQVAVIPERLRHRDGHTQTTRGLTEWRNLRVLFRLPQAFQDRSQADDGRRRVQAFQWCAEFHSDPPCGFVKLGRTATLVAA